jgi:molybdenum cofactor biosynthesis enzyme
MIILTDVNLIVSTIFEALMGVNMKIMVVWDMTPCISLDKYQDPAASSFQV